jgi:CheY-like chemotaxis protein
MQAVGQLAAGVAHDFNNLLTVIRGTTSLIELNPTLSEEDRLSIRELHEACTRAATLISQLLAFSRKQVIQPKILDLNELVTHDTKMLTRLLGEAINLEHQLAPGGVPVRADRGMMDQVILNLAVNARDAMPTGGRLLVSTAVVDVSSISQRPHPDARPGRFSCLTVTDTGCGMDAETQARIFEPFFTTKEVGKGTGLGLATVYGIVKQHDGWIEVTSAPNQGAAFTIFLPHHLATEVAAPERPEADPALRGSETILLVEDEAPVRELARRFLARLGYRVIEAPAGQPALEIWAARKGEIDLLLTDMVMPGGISGIELAQRILAERPHLPVIYTSGYSPDLFTANSTIQEGRNFLAKPYSPDSLARFLRTALPGKPA